MSTETLLIVAGILVSLVFIASFYVYYLYSTRAELLSHVAEDEGYSDRDAYVRDSLYGKPRPLSWSILFYDDAKSIGLRYIFTGLLFMFVAGAFGVLMRVSLTDPNPTILTPTIYNTANDSGVLVAVTKNIGLKKS